MGATGEGSNLCNQPLDPDATVPVYGGCRYEMPLGDCLADLPQSETTGCAYSVEESLNPELSSLAVMTSALTIFEAISFILSCCYCWKRKEQDILPEYLSEVPYDPEQRGSKKKKKS